MLHEAHDRTDNRPADVDEINDLLNEVIQQWIDVCNIDLSDTSYAWSDHRFDNANLVKTGNIISAARDMDPTGLTSFMLLRASFEAYLKHFTVSAWDLILTRGKIDDLIERMKALRDLLESPSVLMLIGDFEDRLRAAARMHGVTDLTKLETLIADKWTLAYIRRDALLALDSLETHQFCQGDPDADELGHNDHILEFWNVNSLLRMMRSQGTPGTSVCLIRDPEELWSYFVFAIVNGANLTILTDRQRREHPHQKYMSRSRAQTKLFIERANRYWFPYELLDLDLTPDQKEIYAKARTALVPINTQAVKLSHIKDLESTDLVWLTLMFDLISKRFGEDAERSKTPLLSYTGEMISEPDTLVGKDSALVRQGHYKTLELEPMTVEAATSDEIRDQFRGRSGKRVFSTGFNHWMVERYQDRVPNEVISSIGALPTHRLLMDASKSVSTTDQWGKQKDPIYSVELAGVEMKLAVGHKGISYVEPTDFGPAEEVAKDRAWHARRNTMVIIKRLAFAEYKETKESICLWYHSRVSTRLEWFITQAVRGELLIPHAKVGFWESKHTRSMENCAFQWEGPWNGNGSDRAWRSRDFPLNEDIEDYYQVKSKCPLTGALTTVHTRFTPTCPEALAFLCGCEVSELPWALQHWFSRAPYMGNSILDRVDPEDWVLENPWMKENFILSLSLSKRGFNRRRKLMGLPRKTWNKEE